MPEAGWRCSVDGFGGDHDDGLNLSPTLKGTLQQRLEFRGLLVVATDNSPLKN